MKKSLHFVTNWIFISLILTLGVQNKLFAQGCTGVNIITLSSNSSTGWGTGFTNTTVYIQSDFLIDNTFTISGCIVIIEPRCSHRCTS